MEVLANRDALTFTLREQVAAHPYGDILLSFPFLGEIAAATIIGIIKDILGSCRYSTQLFSS